MDDLVVADHFRCSNLGLDRCFHHGHNYFLDNDHDHIHWRILDLDCDHGYHGCDVHVRVHGGGHDRLVGNLHAMVDVHMVEVVHAVEVVCEAEVVREVEAAHVAVVDIRMAALGVQGLVVAHKDLAYNLDIHC